MLPEPRVANELLATLDHGHGQVVQDCVEDFEVDQRGEAQSSTVCSVTGKVAWGMGCVFMGRLLGTSEVRIGLERTGGDIREYI